LEFEFQYGEFQETIRPKMAEKDLENIEKAGLSGGESRLAVTKIIHFLAESK